MIAEVSQLGSEWTGFGGLISVGVFMGWGLIRGLSKEKKKMDNQTSIDLRKVIEGKDELIRVREEQVTTWKGQYEIEHQEHKQYRDYAHLKLGEANDKVLAYNAEMIELRAKTDLTPLHQHIADQSKVNERMIDSLTKISETLVILMELVTGKKTSNL